MLPGFNSQPLPTDGVPYGCQRVTGNKLMGLHQSYKESERKATGAPVPIVPNASLDYLPMPAPISSSGSQMASSNHDVLDIINR